MYLLSKTVRVPFLAATMAFVATTCLAATAFADPDSDRQQIDALLDDLHDAAAQADEARYLGYFAPDGVFMGSDDWERWPLPQFREYVAQRFAGGVGWTYHPSDRHVAFAPDGETAWFDELLESPRWGRFRGTGVVQRLNGRWRVAHYSFTLLVPNEDFEPAAEIALEGFRKRDAAKTTGQETP